jgi:Peptidoglycan-synthase activator LpoB
MNSKTTLMLACALAIVPVLSGCRDEGAQVIQQDRSITTVEGIDIQDFRGAAATLTREMMDSPRFSSSMQQIRTAHPGNRPLVKISHIKNDTMLKVDMRGFLVDPMEAELMKGDALDFVAEDDQAQALAKMNETMTGTGPKLPDLILYGTVRDLRSEAGDMKQASYVFHLKAADASGRAVWEGEKLITKQGKRPSIGI